VADSPTRQNELSSDKQALLAIRKLRAKVEELERAKTEPLAIVGVGCRFPGQAEGPDRYWQVLHDGVHAVGPIPRDRLDLDTYYDPNLDAPGKIYVREAAMVDGIDRFDAQFFGISPREATSMDPQHRLLLEVTWEALENAGLAPSALQGSRTGVFVGIGGSDYAQLQMNGGAAGLDAYFGTGSSMSAAPGRLSYVLGLIGPSVAVDTACSASLVAVHLACQSLRSGECRIALAGGVNVMLSPEVFVTLCRAHMLAPDGRCKTFDAAADGYVRGEGCGMIVLKRLSDAIADGDSILAVIRGSAVNQDGKSAGFTAPNERSQQQVIREALAAGGVSPEAVDYIEAHGTGTPLGDPIEIQALAAVLGENRPADRPLLVGSVKTNFGHLEWAAGIAGLIKIVLSLQHQEIPPHLHLQTLNPFVNWDELPIRIPTEPTPWPAGARRRIAGVSSFGFTGTNAHVVLEEAPPIEPQRELVERPLHVLALSARSESSLRELAARMTTHLSDDRPESLADTCFTANAGRSHFAHRLAISGQSRDEVRQALIDWAAGNAPNVRSGRVPGVSQPDVVFLFTGQGAQYPGMSRRLYETQPVFRRALDRCGDLFQSFLERPLLPVMFESANQDTLDQTAYTQPALFALEYALAELWKTWGVEPAVVMGHSLGEYVAACVAGLFSLEDAVKLVATRARLMQSLPPIGAMAAVAADADGVRSIIGAHASAISIAAVNGPASVVISGEKASVSAAVESLTAAGIKVQRLAVSHAFHSALMDPILDAFEQVARSVEYRTPRVGIISNLTGRAIEPAEIGNAGYWRRHLREPVQFAAGIDALCEQGNRIFLEIGPAPTLVGMGRGFVSDPSVAWLPSLRKGHDDWATILDSLAALYVNGVAVDWSGFDCEYGRRKVALPTYPFERRRFWIEGEVHRREALVSAGSEPRRDDWLHEVVWEAQPIPPAASRDAQRASWLVFADGSGVADAFESRLGGESTCFRVDRGEKYEQIDRRRFTCGRDAASVSTMIETFLRSTSSPREIVYLWSADPDAADDAAVVESAIRDATSVLQVIQALAGAQVQPAGRLWIGTRGAQSVTGKPCPIDVARAPLWGLGRTIAAEHPALWGGLVDLDPGTDAISAGAAMAAACSGSDDEDQMAFRGGERYVARLIATDAASLARRELRWRPDGAYLVTGGFGGIALEVARWMVRRGARRLILLGRHALPSRETWADVDPKSAEAARINAVLELEALGASIEAAAVDVGDARQLSDWYAAYRRQQRPPIRGVVHAAGVTQYQLLSDHRAGDLEAIWRGKVTGGWLLHRLLAETPLDFFVLFSSASALINSPLVGSYAAANAFLDALAERRRESGQVALSVNWGAWSQVGMAAAGDERRQAKVDGITPEVGVGMLAALLDRDVTRVAVLPMDWLEWSQLYPAFAAAPFLRRVVDGRAAVARDGDASDPVAIRAALLGAHAPARHEMVSGLVARAVAGVLRLPIADVDPVMPLRNVGLDSLMALELRNMLQHRIGVSVPLVALVEGPSINELASLILETLASAPAEPTSGAMASAGDADPQRLLAGVDGLSDESVDALLRRMLAQQ
jgi:acyl transferase domain-containing protein/acyl carrier protein